MSQGSEHTGTPDRRVRSNQFDRRQMLKAIAAAGGAIFAPSLFESIVNEAPAWAGPTLNGGRGSQGVPGPVGYVPATLVSPPAGQTSQLGYPLGLYVVPGGPVYVADFGSLDGSANGRILSVDSSTGSVTTLFSSGDYWPTDVAVDSSGDIYFTDYGWDDDDAGPGNPSATGVAEDGRLVVLARSISSAQTLAGPLTDPSYLLLDQANGVIYLSDTGEADGSGNADPSGRVLSYPLHTGSTVSVGSPVVVAGTGSAITNGQPLPTQPVVNRPATSINIFVAFGLALFGSTLYVSDEYAHVVYRVDLRRDLISTYAGNGQSSGPSGDGDTATSAVVPYPQGLTVDCLGNLYILELSGDIRRVDVKSKAITTVSSIPPTSNNVGIKYDSADGSLWVVYNDVPSQGTSGLYRVA